MNPSENWFRALAENAGHSIYFTDPEGTIQYVNPAFEEMTGYSREEVIGENPNVLQSGKHSDEFYEELWSTILDGETWHSEIINQHKNGETYYADQTISPITDDSGEIEGFVAINVDITERKEKRNFIEQIYDRLEEEHKRISRELHDQLGHKLLYGLMKLRTLRDKNEETDSRDQLQEVINILEDSINQVRDMTSVIRPPSLDEKNLSDILKSHGAKVSERHAVNVAVETVGSLNSDRVNQELKQGLYRVAQESIMNAIKHGDADQITVLLSTAGDQLSLLVEDNGTGFDREKMNQAPLRKKVGVVGMRERVQLLGGAFELESSPGNGTRVKAVAPLDTDPNEASKRIRGSKYEKPKKNR